MVAGIHYFAKQMSPHAGKSFCILNKLQTLQVKVLDQSDRQLDLVGCIVQVFKLRGADRKHKQDKDKMSRKMRSDKMFFLAILFSN